MKGFPHIFHLCPLSRQPSQMIPLVKVFPGNACTNINLCMYSEWTNCSNLLEGVSFFNYLCFPPTNIKKNDNQQSFFSPQAVTENPDIWWELCLMWFCIYKHVGGRRDRAIIRWAGHMKCKIHERCLSNWEIGTLPLEDSSGWKRRTEWSSWGGYGEGLASSSSFVSTTPPQNAFQEIFWYCSGSHRRLCASRDYSVCRMDSILSILLTSLQVQMSMFCSPEHLERELKSDQEGHLHGSFSCPISFPFSFPSFPNWRPTLSGSVRNTQQEQAHKPHGKWWTAGGDLHHLLIII